MSRLLELRAAIVTAIQTRLPGWDVAGHLGRFDAASLRDFMAKAPAVRVAVLGFSAPVTLDGGLIQVKARLGVYIATKDRATKLSRDAAVAAAAEAVAVLIAGNRFGLAYAWSAGAPAAQNLWSDETLKLGLALWALDWDQEVWLEAAGLEDPGGAGAPLEALFVGLAPDIGPAHVDDYVGPIPEADDA